MIWVIPPNDLQAQVGVAELETTSIYLKADINHRLESYKGWVPSLTTRISR